MFISLIFLSKPLGLFLVISIQFNIDKVVILGEREIAHLPLLTCSFQPSSSPFFLQVSFVVRQSIGDSHVASATDGTVDGSPPCSIKPQPVLSTLALTLLFPSPPPLPSQATPIHHSRRSRHGRGELELFSGLILAVAVFVFFLDPAASPWSPGSASSMATTSPASSSSRTARTIADQRLPTPHA